MTDEGPSLHEHWRAHVAMFCAAAGGFCNLYAMQALVPALEERFGTGSTYAASLLTATTLGLALSAPFAGRVAARFGPRSAVIGALCALAGMTVAMAFTSNATLLVLLRFMQGICIPVALTALLANAAKTWPEVNTAALAATYVTGCLIGGVAGRLVPAALMQWGWPLALTCFACLQFAAALTVHALHPNNHESRAEVAELREWAKAIAPTLRHDIPAQAIGGFCLLFSQAAVTSYVAIRLAGEPFGWTTTALGALYLVFLPALVFVRLTPRGIASMGSAKTLVVALAASWAGLALTIPGSVASIVVGLTLFSASIFVGQTVLAHLVSTAATQRKEMASGLYLSSLYAGASAGALAPASAWAEAGWIGCLAVVAAVQTVGVVVARSVSSEPRLVLPNDDDAGY